MDFLKPNIRKVRGFGVSRFATRSSNSKMRLRNRQSLAKSSQIYFDLVRSQFGWCGAVFEDQYLIRFFLPLPKEDALNLIKKEFPNAKRTAVAKKLVRDVSNYFKGEKVLFKFPLHMHGLTSFEKSVLQAVAEIPYGKLLTYKDIAKRIGRSKAARAVGRAVGKNPFPLIIPCHRVIRSDGKIGGFSAAGGIALKKKMLKLEMAFRK